MFPYICQGKEPHPQQTSIYPLESIITKENRPKKQKATRPNATVPLHTHTHTHTHTTSHRYRPPLATAQNQQALPKNPQSHLVSANQPIKQPTSQPNKEKTDTSPKHNLDPPPTLDALPTQKAHFVARAQRAVPPLVGPEQDFGCRDRDENSGLGWVVCRCRRVVWWSWCASGEFFFFFFFSLLRSLWLVRWAGRLVVVCCVRVGVVVVVVGCGVGCAVGGFVVDVLLRCAVAREVGVEA